MVSKIIITRSGTYIFYEKEIILKNSISSSNAANCIAMLTVYLKFAGLKENEMIL